MASLRKCLAAEPGLLQVRRVQVIHNSFTPQAEGGRLQFALIGESAIPYCSEDGDRTLALGTKHALPLVEPNWSNVGCALMPTRPPQQCHGLRLSRLPSGSGQRPILMLRRTPINLPGGEQQLVIKTTLNGKTTFYKSAPHKRVQHYKQ